MKFENSKDECYRYTQALDMYEDRVRSRLIFPLVALFLLCYFTFTIAAPEIEKIATPTNIHIAIDPASTVTIGLEKAMQRAVRLIVYDKDEVAMLGVNIELKLISIETAKRKGKPVCDTRTRSTFPGSLERLRVFPACKADVNNTRFETDETGNAVVNKFEMISGPEGIYTLQFIVGSVSSKRMSIYLETKATSIQVLTPQVYRARYGVPLVDQIHLRLSDTYGNPLQFKRAFAISWPEHTLETSKASQSYVQADKFALLLNDESSLSDERGVVVFNNLTILASTSKYVFIVFVVDAEISAPWQAEDNTTFSLPEDVPRLRVPIVMEEDGDNEMKVETLIPPSSAAVEGEEFESQPQFKVSYVTSAKPVEGVGCIGYILRQGRDLFPRGYKFSQFHKKYLVKPVAGNWSESFEDPLAPSMMKAYTTEEKGVIEFRGLGVSQEGSLESKQVEFQLQFRCGSALSEVFTVTVETSVANLTFKESWPSYFRFSRETQYDFENVLQVVNRKGKGIPGKTVGSVRAYDESGQLLGMTVIEEVGQSLYSIVSDKDGIFQVFLKVKRATQYSVYIEIEIDGVALRTERVDVLNPFPDSNYCNYLVLESPLEVSVTVGESFKVQARGYTEGGNKVSYISGKIELVQGDKYYDTPAPVPTSLAQFNGETVFGGALGQFAFTACKFTSAYEGVHFLTVTMVPAWYSYWDDYSSQSCVLPQPIRVHVANPKEHFVTIASPSSSIPFNTMLPLGSQHAVTYRVYDYFGNITRNTKYEAQIEIHQIPPQYYFLYLSKGTNHFVEIFPGSDAVVDANGQITISFRIKPQFPGRWAVAFKFDGSSTDPISFVTDYPKASLNVVGDPFASGTYYSVWMRVPEDIQVNLTCDTGINDYVVTVIPEGVNSTDLGIVTPTLRKGGGTCNDSALYVSELGFHNAVTDAKGIGRFSNLMMLDVGNGYGCFRLRFVFGEPGMIIASALSSQVCFANNFSFSVQPDYTTRVGVGKKLLNPFTLNFEMQNAQAANITCMSFKIVPSVVNGEKYDSEARDRAAEKWTEGSTCLIKRQADGSLASPNCGFQTLVSETANTTEFQVSFSNFLWTKASRSEKIQFEVSYPLSRQQSTLTSIVEFTNKPTNLEIIVQPPQTVKLHEPFRVYIKSSLSDGTLLQYVQVRANISAEVSSDKSEVTTSKIINALGGGRSQIDQLALLFTSSMATLDEVQCYASTDDQGVAKFNLKFVSGKSGLYRLIFESQGVKSEFSRDLYLDNEISEVNIVGTEGVKLTIKESERVSGVTYPFRFRMQVADSSGAGICGKASAFKPYIISETDIDSAYSRVMNNEGSKENISLANISLGYNVVPSDTPSEVLKKTWKVLTNSGEAVGNSKLYNPLARAKTMEIAEVNGTYEVYDMVLTNLEAGKYYMMFVVEGIESSKSKAIDIEVVQDDRSVFKGAWEPVLGCVLIITTLLANSLWLTKLWTVLGICACGTELFLVEQAVKGTTFRVLSFIILSLLIVLLIFLLVRDLQQGEFTHFIDFKHEVFKEYTRQKFKIYYLLAAEDERSTHSLETGRMLDQRGAGRKDEPRHSSPFEEVKSSGAVFPIDYPLYAAAAAATATATLTMPGTTAQALNLTSYKKRTLLQKALSILKPFGHDYKNIEVPQDAFYYPQRFIASLLLGFLTFVFFAIIMTNFFISSIDSIEQLKNEIQKALGAFISTAVERTERMFSYDPSDTDLSPFFGILDYVISQLGMLQRALKISFIIGTVLSCFCFAFSFLLILHNFKKRVMSLRTRQKPKMYGKVQFGDSADFPGHFISNCATGYVAFNALFVLIFTVLCHELLWELFAEYWGILLAIIACLVGAILLMVFIEHVLYGKCMTAKSRPIAHVFEAVIYFISIIGGVAGSFARILIGLPLTLAALVRLDKPMLAKWILNKMYLDLPNASYLGMVKVHAQFNNPIASTFCALLLECSHRSRGERLVKRAYCRIAILREVAGLRQRVVKGSTPVDSTPAGPTPKHIL